MSISMVMPGAQGMYDVKNTGPSKNFFVKTYTSCGLKRSRSMPSLRLGQTDEDIFFKNLAEDHKAELVNFTTNDICTLPREQAIYVWKYLANTPKKNDKEDPKIASKVRLYDAMVKLGKVGFDLSKLIDSSPIQRQTIVLYCAQMIDCGYKKSFVIDVGNIMADLYQYVIEDDAFKTIEDVLTLMKSTFGGMSGYVNHGHFLTLSTWVEKFSTRYMSEHGGNYSKVQRYHKAQRCFSWSEQSVSYKGFCLWTREDLNKEFYFLWNPGDRDPWKEENKLYYEYGEDENHIPDTDYSSDSEDEDPDCKDYKGDYGTLGFLKNFAKMPDIEEYKKTMTIDRAFTAIVLTRTDVFGWDESTYSLELTRAVSSYIPNQAQGIADSAAFLQKTDSIDGCLGGNTYYPEHFSWKDGYSIIKFRLPICDVYGCSFLSKSLGCEEKEAICNLGHINVTAVQTGRCKGKKKELKIGNEEPNLLA